MSAWLTAKEIADLDLIGLPSSEFGVRKRAAADKWVTRRRKGKGGGKEYNITSLPESARKEIVRRRRISDARTGAGVPPFSAPPENTPAPTVRNDNLGALPPKSREVAEARLAILAELDDRIALSGLPQAKAMVDFAQDYTDRAIEFDPKIYELIESVSKPTLERWKSAFKKHGATALAPNYGNRRGDSQIDRDDEVATFIIGMIAERPHVRAKIITEGLVARFGPDRAPNYDAVARWVKNFKSDSKRALTAIADPDGFNNKYRAAGGSYSDGVVRPNQLWEIDSTIADLELLDGRYAIIAICDVYTRRFKMLIAKTSTANAIAALLRRTLMDWGVPELLKTDNGQDYKSRHIAAILKMLDIEMKRSKPFSGWEKPHVERCFRTFQHHTVEALPGYVGHDVPERKKIEARKSFADRLGDKEIIKAEYTFEQFQAICDEWCENYYHHQPHSNLNGASPFDVARGYPGIIRTIDDERALDVLLAPAVAGDGTRTVGKKGIRIGGVDYDAPLLGGYVGDKVRVTCDEQDMGRVYVFSLEGPFICVATAPELRGIQLVEFAKKKGEIQRKAMAEEKEKLRAAARKAKTKDIALEILKDHGARNGKVAILPGRQKTHNTEGLTEAGRAARAEDPKVRTLSPAAVKAAQELAEASKPAPQPITVDPINRALALYERQAAGKSITDDEKIIVERAMRSPRFRAALELKQIEADGEFALTTDGIRS